MGFSKKKLIKGTLLLTIAGFLTRILGFIYKIYLADLMGAKMLGMYQLVFPVYAVCFTIYGAGMQTAISQITATEIGKSGHRFASFRLPMLGTLTGLSLAILLEILVSNRADFIASRLLLEPGLVPYLKILCRLFPFCCLSACINGYYYGIQAAKVPAISQFIEQLARICFVFLANSLLLTETSPEQACLLAVWGLVIGEVTACIYNVAKILHLYRIHSQNPLLKKHPSQSLHLFHGLRGMWELLVLACTLTLTRLFVTLLNSAESALLPAMLRKYGCSPDDALSIYGILTGMTLSFLLFPSTITNSLSVLLIPSIAEADARNDHHLIQRSIFACIRYCLLLGMLCTCLFLLFGHDLGVLFFHNEDAGDYLTALSWLCPFLYLGTTLTGIINGMKKNQVTFLITIVSLGIKLLILIQFVPIWGIKAYLMGFLLSQLIQVALELLYLRKYMQGSGKLFHPFQWIVFPGLFLGIMGSITKYSYQWLGSCVHHQYLIGILCLAVGSLCLCYFIWLYVIGCIEYPIFKKAPKPMFPRH